MRVETAAGRRGDQRAAGFTLLEVLVALIIFAIAFGALVGLFQTSLRQTGTAEELRRATVLAEAQLARFGRDLPLALGRVDGVSADGELRWQADVSLARPVEEDAAVALYQIRIDAGRGEGASSLVSLTTLRLGSR
ncbi:MAG: type IV pilus modification PilV family protein [Geminicoccaceae bacterium]